MFEPFLMFAEVAIGCAEIVVGERYLRMFGAEYPLVDFQRFLVIFDSFPEIAEAETEVGEIVVCHGDGLVVALIDRFVYLQGLLEIIAGAVVVSKLDADNAEVVVRFADRGMAFAESLFADVKRFPEIFESRGKITGVSGWSEPTIFS